jgi:hypothetical protein
LTYASTQSRIGGRARRQGGRVDRFKGLFLTGLGLALAGVSAGAQASQQTYQVYVGPNSYISILATSASNGSTLVNNAPISLTSGSFVEFDNSAMQLPSWEFTNSGSVSVPITAGSLSGDSLLISDLTVVPGSPYSSTVATTGTNGSTTNYSFTLGALTVTGDWELLNSSNQEVTNGTINHTVSTFNGTFGVSGSAMQSLTLTGISLGAIDNNAINLSGTVNFNGGVVPVPAAAWLLGSGLVGLLLVGVRRRYTEGTLSHAL